MGKASKWIRNYLMGKKEEKHKKIDSSSIDSNKTANNIGSQMESPKVKRRWSFGKILGGRIAGKAEVHKLCRSFGSNDSPKLQIQAIVETQPPETLPTSLANVSDDIENSAATKIQAAFRSYLARKALHALRGLVKIQALVRGHLVRKQTTSTLRGMHALMAIQVRARIQRIKMAEVSRLLVGEQNREIPLYKHLIREKKDSKDMSLSEMSVVLKSRSGPLGRSHVESAEQDSRTSYSMTPKYMNKTESSMAKARSQSEPKQRPRRSMRHKNKPIESPKDPTISLDGQRIYMSSSSSRYSPGSFDNSVNLYGLLKDIKGDSFSSSGGGGYY